MAIGMVHGTYDLPHIYNVVHLSHISPLGRLSGCKPQTISPRTLGHERKSHCRMARRKMLSACVKTCCLRYLAVFPKTHHPLPLYGNRPRICGEKLAGTIFISSKQTGHGYRPIRQDGQQTAKQCEKKP